MNWRWLRTIPALALALGATAPAAATFDARNGRLAFVEDVGGTRQLFTMRSNGRDLTQISDVDAVLGLPDWSPDGTMLTFTSDDCSVGVVNADGSGFRILPPEDPTTTPGETVCDGDSSFTPDGRILYGHFNAETEIEDLRTMRLDGTDRHVLFQACCDPNLSPDGTLVSYRDGDGPLTVANLDGTNRRQVSPEDWAVGIKTDWAPDGSLLAFSDFRQPAPTDAVNLWVVRPDGSGARQLTHFTDPSITAYSGSFSPDGQWIAFRVDHNADGLHAVFRIRPDGTDLHRITGWSPDTQRSVDWGPAPAP